MLFKILERSLGRPFPRLEEERARAGFLLKRRTLTDALDLGPVEA